MYLCFDPEVRALLASIETARPNQIVTDRFPTVVIVGGGFGGLAAAKALRNTPVRVILFDRF
jgi:cation diffusion facilitator CzcD-associated flavoprotein CzcO